MYMGKIGALLLAFFPSGLKISILRLLGHEIGADCYIGLSIINVEKIRLDDNTYIGHGNVMTGIKYLWLNEGSRINR